MWARSRGLLFRLLDSDRVDPGRPSIVHAGALPESTHSGLSARRPVVPLAWTVGKWLPPHDIERRKSMTEKPQETEGIIKGGKREPVARDDEFPPEGGQDTVDETAGVEENPGGPRPR